MVFAETHELVIEDLSVDASLLFDEEDLGALHDARLCAFETACASKVDTFEDRPDPYAPTHWVYAICNLDGTPFYVGQTNCLERRRQEHRDSISALPKLRERLSDPANRPRDTVLTFRRIERIAKLLAEGTGPILQQLGKAWSRGEALALETTWVHRMTAKGHKLLNPCEHRAIAKQYASHRRYERKYQSDTAQNGTR